MERLLNEDERRALRGSKFAPLPSLPSRTVPRLAHPNGPIATNKAAALAKFLERKLQQPDGLNSIDPKLLELAVQNAKETVSASNGEASSSGRIVRHVSSFGSISDSKEDCEGNNKILTEEAKPKKKKRKKASSSMNPNRETPKQKKKFKNLKGRKKKKSKKFKS